MVDIRYRPPQLSVVNFQVSIGNMKIVKSQFRILFWMNIIISLSCGSVYKVENFLDLASNIFDQVYKKQSMANKLSGYPWRWKLDYHSFRVQNL
jgi:hypothetical protein